VAKLWRFNRFSSRTVRLLEYDQTLLACTDPQNVSVYQTSLDFNHFEAFAERHCTRTCKPIPNFSEMRQSAAVLLMIQQIFPPRFSAATLPALFLETAVKV